MSRKSSLLATIVSASLVAGCGTDAQLKVRPVGAQAVMPVGDLLAQGRTNFMLGNVALALERFRRAARLQPDNVDALNGIAACYDRLGRFDLSRFYYEKALALAPDNTKTLHNFRLSLTIQGKHGEAMALAAEPARPQVTSDGYASTNAPEGVTVALSPPEPLPVEPPEPARPQPKLAEPFAPEEMPAGPRLERLSLSEVALVTAPGDKAPAGKQASPARKQPGERVVRVAKAELVRKTDTGSEWVLPEPAAVTPAPAAAPVRAANAEVTKPVVPNPLAVVVLAPEPALAVQSAAAPPAPAPTPDAEREKPTAPRPPAIVVLAPPPPAPPFHPVAIARPAAPPRQPSQFARASARAPAPASVPGRAAALQVLNAVGRKGLAGRYSRYLGSRGWAPLQPHDARRKRRETVILYSAGSRAQALALANRLPFRASVARSSRRGSGLVLVLGNDALAFDNRLRLRSRRA